MTLDQLPIGQNARIAAVDWAALADEEALRLQALGLDCGPMSGFDAARVDAAFWVGTAVKTNFVSTLGHGDPAKVMPRLPRLAFEDACRLL